MMHHLDCTGLFISSEDLRAEFQTGFTVRASGQIYNRHSLAHIPFVHARTPNRSNADIFSSLLLEKLLEPSKGFVDQSGVRGFSCFGASSLQVVKIPPVLIVMAVDAQILPVAPIGRVIGVVVVLVVHG
jgi:hypothetical protein